MNTLRSTEIKVGLVSIIAIILFIVGLSLGSGINVAAAAYNIKLRFPNSAGIKQTAPLVVNGVERGEIISVENDNGSVLITAEIDDISDLKSDVSALIMVLEITGGKKIELSPGASDIPFNEKNEIPGKTAGDMGAMLAMGADLGKDAALLVRRVDTLLASANYLLADGVLLNDIKQTVGRSSEFAANLNNLLNQNSHYLVTAIRNINDISSELKTAINNNAPKADSLVIELSHTLNSIQTLVKHANSAINGADELVTNINGIANDLKSGDGMISKILYDRDLGQELELTLNKLNELVEFINKKGVNVNVELGHARMK